MLNGAEISVALSDIEAFANGAEHLELQDAYAAVQQLIVEIRPAAEGVRRPDKGTSEVYRHPSATDALHLIDGIRSALDRTAYKDVLEKSAQLRDLSIRCHWI